MSEYRQPPLPTERAQMHVVTTCRPDGSLKKREVWEPNEELREEHHKALNTFRTLNIPMPHALGGMPGSRIYDNAAIHRGSQEFYLLDLKDAYQSVDIDKLRETMKQALARCAIGSNVFKELDDFITDDATIEGVPGLPLGLPASPYLCNLYFSPMDNGLHHNLNGRLSPEDNDFVTITRWIDDIALSSASKVFSIKKRGEIRDIIEQNGGEVNHGKTKRHSLLKGPVTITGMSLYPDGRIAPSPRLMDQVVTHLKEARERFERGELTWVDIDDLNGQKSILHMTKDGSPASSGQESVRRLAMRYEAFIEEAIASLDSRSML